MAEGLGKALQKLLRGFKSLRHLQIFYPYQFIKTHSSFSLFITTGETMLNEKKTLEGLLAGEKKLVERIKSTADPKKRIELEEARKGLEHQIKIKQRSIKKSSK